MEIYWITVLWLNGLFEFSEEKMNVYFNNTVTRHVIPFRASPNMFRCLNKNRSVSNSLNFVLVIC